MKRRTWLAGGPGALLLLLHVSRAFAREPDASGGPDPEAPAVDAGAPSPADAPDAAAAPAPSDPAGSPAEGAAAPVSVETAVPGAPPTFGRLRSVVAFDVGGYIDTTATTVLTPSIGANVSDPTAGWNVSGRYLVDMVSAASPDIVATASPNWKELRNAGNVGGLYKPGNYGIGGAITTSYTRDYLSLGFTGQLVQELDEKNLTLTESYTFGHDIIGRTGTSFSTFARTFDYHAISLGASRVVNPTLVLGLTADLVIERGDQSKPYRYVPMFSAASAAQVDRGEAADRIAELRVQARPLEQLPLARERGAVTGRAGWRLADRHTLRLEERLYLDTWDQRASTTDLRWIYELNDRWMLWPHGRLHVQNGADFWRRAYAVSSAHDLPALRTGDRELSPLDNLTFGAGARIALGKRGQLGRALDDVVLNAGADATRTYFKDAMYVSQRWSVLLTTGMEVAF